MPRLKVITSQDEPDERHRAASGGAPAPGGDVVRIGRAGRREGPGGAAAAGRRRARRVVAPAGGLRHARRQPGAHRRQVDLPHRRRPGLAAQQGDGRDAQALARRDRDARHHRLSSAGHPHRDRGDPRGDDLQGLGRRAAADRMDQAARAAQGARPPGDLRHQREPSCRISGSTRSAICRGSTSSKGSGLLDGRLPPGFSVPIPSDDAALREDEDPLEPGDLDLGLAPPPERIRED